MSPLGERRTQIESRVLAVERELGHPIFSPDGYKMDNGGYLTGSPFENVGHEDPGILDLVIVDRAGQGGKLGRDQAEKLAEIPEQSRPDVMLLAKSVFAAGFEDMKAGEPMAEAVGALILAFGDVRKLPIPDSVKMDLMTDLVLTAQAGESASQRTSS